jgi:hypothetical protein
MAYIATINGNIITSSVADITGDIIAATASYAVTASYVAASNVDGLDSSRIAIGDVTASVGLSNETFKVVSGSNTFLFLSSSGNVGLGTITPNYKLNVSGTTSVQKLVVNTSGQELTFTNNYELGSDGLNIYVGGGGLNTSKLGGPTFHGSNNTAIGALAMLANTSGRANTAVGWLALQNNTTGFANTAIGGRAALASNTTGYYNIAVGTNALELNIDGIYNIAIGGIALGNGRGGSRNVAVGTQALSFNSGSNNTALGDDASGNITNRNTTGNNNIFIGYQSVGVSSTESNRTWIGNTSTTSTWLAGNLLLGSRTDLGFRAQITQDTAPSGSLLVSGSTVMSGSLSVTQGITGSLFGTASWAENTISASYVSGSDAIVTNLTSSNDARINGIRVGKGPGGESTTTIVGDTSGLNLTSNAYSNTIIGSRAGNSLTVGSYNVLIGDTAGYRITGNECVIVGTGAGFLLTSGINNTFLGNDAGNNVSTGQSNIMIGRRSGLGITTGNYNTVIGAVSGLAGTTSNNIILADGQGNIKYRWDATQNNIYGNLAVTGSVQISQVLVLPPQSPLPSGVPTGSLAVSGSGVDCKPYFWNGSTWTPLF